MNPITIFFIGLAMSTDAFAAAIGKGAGMRKPSLLDALRAGLIFGVIEASTPLIGWLIGQAASAFIGEWAPWIALALLTLLGLHMIYAGLKNEDEKQEALPDHHGFWTLALTGFATSIDAMAVGVGLALLEVNIFVVSVVIGLCTFIMVTIGIMLGRLLGALVGRGAEVVGGAILIAVGITIVWEHYASAL